MPRRAPRPAPENAPGTRDRSGPRPADDALPFIDEHRIAVAAPADVVWRALGQQVAQQNIIGSPLLVRWSERNRQASGTPFEEGPTVPGYAVTASVPGQRVRLAGRHRYSRYALESTMSATSGGTALAARSFAQFPGVTGFLYRRPVIGSGAHRVLVRRILAAVRRHAEAQGLR